MTGEDNEKMIEDSNEEEEEQLPPSITKDDNGKYQWTCDICQKTSDAKFKTLDEVQRSLYGHKLSAHGVSERVPRPRTPEQEIERAIRDALYVVDIPSQKHSGIVRLILSGDYQNPEYIKNILITMKIPEEKAKTVARIVEVAIKKINDNPQYGFSNFPISTTSPNEMIKSLIQMLNERQQLQQLDLLVRQMMEGVSERRPRRLEDGTTVWMTDKEYTDYLIQMEKIRMKKQEDDGANKRKIRILDDGSQVPMTDEEYAQYKIAMATRVGSGSKNEELIKLQERIAELEKERERLLIEGLKKELSEKLDDIERRVGVSDFERFKYFKQKARELGFVVSGDRSGETELKLKEMENKVQLLTKTMDNMARKTDTMIQTVSPIIRALSSKILLDSGAKPPVLRKYTSEQMNSVADGFIDNTKEVKDG